MMAILDLTLRAEGSPRVTLLATGVNGAAVASFGLGVDILLDGRQLRELSRAAKKAAKKTA